MAISATLLIFPAMTHLPMKFIMSTMSLDVKDSPHLLSNNPLNNECSSMSGWGPEEVPPNVFRGSPAGLMCE